MKKWTVCLALCMLLSALFPLTAFAAGESVARIGERSYESILAAVADAADGDTIVITESHAVDCSGATVLSGSIYSLINVEKTLRLDLNGKHISANTGDRNIILINVQNGGALTIDDSAGGGAVSVTAGVDTYALLSCLDEDSGLTVNGGSFSLNMGQWGQGMVYAALDGTTVINGGSFYLGNIGSMENGSPWIFNSYSNNANCVRVNGGSFNGDVNHQHWCFEVEVAEDKAVKNNGDGTWTVVPAAARVKEWEYISKYVNGKHTKDWYIHPVGYASLEEALAAVETRDGITEDVALLGDCVLNDTLYIDESFTLDPNGYSIRWEGDGNKAILTVAEGDLLTLENFTPLRPGYRFGGWYTDAALTTPFDFSSGTVPGGTSLYAGWNAADCSIRWINEGVIFAATTQKFGEKLILPADDPTKALSDGFSYTFLGWFTAPEGGTQLTEESIVDTEDAAYYAQYSRYGYFGEWTDEIWEQQFKASETVGLTPAAPLPELKLPQTGGLPLVGYILVSLSAAALAIGRKR